MPLSPGVLKFAEEISQFVAEQVNEFALKGIVHVDTIVREENGKTMLVVRNVSDATAYLDLDALFLRLKEAKR